MRLGEPPHAFPDTSSGEVATNAADLDVVRALPETSRRLRSPSSVHTKHSCAETTMNLSGPERLPPA